MRLIAPTPLVGRFLTPAIIAAGFVFCMAVNLPGHLSYDSVMQLLEGRAGTYSGWHPPIMSWLLGVADAALPGTGLFVFTNSLLLFVALASLIWTTPRPSWFVLLTAAVLVLSPQVLLYQGVVWKDVLFANAGVAGFVTLAHLGPAWQSPPPRYSLLALSFALLLLAALARQNGVILILFGAIAVVWAVRMSGLSRASSIALGGVALTVSVAVLLLANVALQTRVSGLWGPVRQLKLLEMYDLTGALAAQPSTNLERLKRSDPQLLALMQTDGRRLYSPQRTDTFTKSNALERARAAAPIAPLREQWLEFIRGHPRLYLRIRAQVFRWVFLTPDIGLCVPFYFGIDGPPGPLKWLGLKPRYDDRDQALQTYGEHFLGTPAFSHLFFFLMALGEAVFLFFRRRVSDIAIGMMLAAAMAFTATFFVIAIACDYRYLYFLDLAAMTGLFYIALDPRASRDPQRPNG